MFEYNDVAYGPSNCAIFAIGGQNKGEFEREAAEFANENGVPKRNILVCAPPKSLHERTRMADTLDYHIVACAREEPVDAIAIFCHGWTLGLQCGWNVRTVQRHVERISDAVSAGVVVVTYSCSAADGTAAGRPKMNDCGPASNGGFCDELRDQLCLAGLPYCSVFGHSTPGHTTRNPYVIEFDGTGDLKRGRGGKWVVAPGDKKWRTWRALLGGSFRFQYPFVPSETLAQYVQEILG